MIFLICLIISIVGFIISFTGKTRKFPNIEKAGMMVFACAGVIALVLGFCILVYQLSAPLNEKKRKPGIL